MNSPRTSTTVSSALQLLRILANRPEGMRLSEVAEALDTGKSRAHLLLSTLVAHGFARKLSSGSYGLGLGAFEVGSAVPDGVRYGGALAVPMRDLADQSGESVSLAVVHGKHAVIVQRFESQQVLRAEIRIGTRMPLFTCASGKYLLAHMSDTEIDTLYGEEDLPYGASQARIRSKRELITSFSEIRTRNYATNFDEYAEGIHGIATGVFNPAGEVVAALSIAGPSNRFTPEEWIDGLRYGADRMTAIQGKRP